MSFLVHGLMVRRELILERGLKPYHEGVELIWCKVVGKKLILVRGLKLKTSRFRTSERTRVRKNLILERGLKP